jgi:hypothetical protein
MVLSYYWLEDTIFLFKVQMMVPFVNAGRHISRANSFIKNRVELMLRFVLLTWQLNRAIDTHHPVIPANQTVSQLAKTAHIGVLSFRA